MGAVSHQNFRLLGGCPADEQPVRDLAGDYETWLEQGLDIVPEADHDAVSGKTAAAFHGIDISS
jgi:hypothetical protein